MKGFYNTVQEDFGKCKIDFDTCICTFSKFSLPAEGLSGASMSLMRTGDLGLLGVFVCLFLFHWLIIRDPGFL